MAGKAEVILSAPPVAVGGAKLIFGYTLPEWAAIVTIGYTLLLATLLIANEYRKWRERRDKRSEE